MRKFLSFLLAILAVLGSNSFCFACNTRKEDASETSNILGIEREESLEIMISEKIKKIENIIYLNYNYGEEFKDNDYKYKKVRVETTYYDVSKGSNDILAVSYMEFNFRYNEFLNEAKCLSSIHGQMCNNEKYAIKVLTRTKNSRYDMGESFGSFEFSKKSGTGFKKICNSAVIFSCDPSGRIVHKIKPV